MHSFDALEWDSIVAQAIVSIQTYGEETQLLLSMQKFLIGQKSQLGSSTKTAKQVYFCFSWRPTTTTQLVTYRGTDTTLAWLTRNDVPGEPRLRDTNGLDIYIVSAVYAVNWDVGIILSNMSNATS